MAGEDGRRINWYTRHWSDWPEVYRTVIGVAKAHARYLGYKVHSVDGNGPPPGDPGEAGPGMRIKLTASRPSGENPQPTPEQFRLDLERRAPNCRLNAPEAAAY